MKQLFAACMLVGLLAGSAAAQTTSGRITGNETWSGTVTITGDLEIIGATVTVAPGTRVRFVKGQSAGTVVNGTVDAICLILRDGAGFYAMGTEAQPIYFTSAEASPAPGDWCEIDVAGAVDTAHTRFEHCVFEYGKNAFDFRSGQTSGDWSTIELDNPINIEYCTIRHMAASGMYITSGGEPNIRHCTFHDIVSGGIFAHGAKTVEIEFCTIYDVSVGIISPGEGWWSTAQKVYSINNTIDNVRAAKDDTPTWWTGYGIWCGNTRGTLYLRNTVISNTTNAGVSLNGWGLSKKNNCYYETGNEPIEGGAAIASSSIEADPLFTAAASGDYSLRTGSPCTGAGFDGTNMGAWQPPAAAVNGDPAAAAPLLSAGPNPAETGHSITVRGGAAPLAGRLLAADGTVLRSFTLAGNGAAAALAPVHEAGVYFIHAGGQAVRLLVR